MAVVEIVILIGVCRHLVGGRQVLVVRVLARCRQRAVVAGIVTRHIILCVVVDAAVQLVAAPTLCIYRWIPFYTVVDADVTEAVVHNGTVDDDHVVASFQVWEFQSVLRLVGTVHVAVDVGTFAMPLIHLDG